MAVLPRGSYLKGRAFLKRCTLEWYARVATSRLSDGERGQDTWHQFALMHPVQPGPGDCLQRVFGFGETPICG